MGPALTGGANATANASAGAANLAGEVLPIFGSTMAREAANQRTVLTGAATSTTAAAGTAAGKALSESGGLIDSFADFFKQVFDPDE